jgi:hypothetical protein
MITQMKIDNVMSRKEAERKIEQFNVRTAGNFHNFNFIACPAYGSFDIIVESEYFKEGSERERQFELLEAFNFAIISDL